MAKDMTKGSITPMLVGFTIPLVLGNLFQLTYNAADSIIVGQHVGTDALAAVGICNPIMTTMMLFMNGLCIGAGILMGNQYGAGDMEKLHRQISTSLIAGLIFSGCLSICGSLLSAQILRLMRVDQAIFGLTDQYLGIVMLGMVFSFLYNFYSAVFRALGDSRTPLYFLVLSSIINVFGDLFFVIVLHMGSFGCALATVISEFLCALCCFLYVQKKSDVLRICRGWFVFDKDLLKQTIAYGWAAAMQQAVVPLGRMVVQGVVNTMGVNVVAAFSACSRVDDFCFTPQQNIGHAMTAFMAQNRGAGEKERMKKGFIRGMALEFAYGFLIMAIVYFGAERIMGLFTSKNEVIAEGVKYMHIVALAYILPAVTNGIQGFFRGIGRLKITLLSTAVNIGTRCLSVIPIMLFFTDGIETFPYAYTVGWICMLAVELPLNIKAYREI